jgi:hypothetical protein
MLAGGSDGGDAIEFDLGEPRGQARQHRRTCSKTAKPDTAERFR